MNPDAANPEAGPYQDSRSLRLLLISYEYPPLGGGLGKAVRQTALELEKLGHEVAILTSRFGDLPSADSDGPLRVTRIPVLRRHANHARLIDVLSFGVSGVLMSKRRLRDFRPDVVIAYLTVPSGVVGAWLSRRWGVPLLTLLRGTDVPGHRELEPWMHQAAGPLIRWIWRRSSHVISNSEAMARQAEGAVAGLSVSTVHNGVDLDRYRPPEPGCRSAAPVRVLYSGRLVKVKRLDAVIRTWAEVVRKSQAPLVLDLAGFGPERDVLERLVSELGLGDSVRFLGYLDEERMIRAYQEASLFVSFSRDEGLPNSVLEAMACGLPLVLSDIGPHREILADSGAGVLADPDDPDSLGSSLLRMIHSPEERELMGQLGRTSVEGRFSWKRTAAGLQQFFPGADSFQD